MPKHPRKRINPYLFLLLKKLVEYEVPVITERVTRTDIFNFFYVQILKSYDPTFDKKGKGAAAYSANYTESFIKTAWEPTIDIEDPSYKSYCYSTNKLNELVGYISKAGSFKSWEEFKKKYENDPGAIASEKYMTLPFFQYSDETRKTVEKWAEKKFMKIDFFTSQKKYSQGNLCNMVTDDDNLRLIRTGTPEELREFSKKDKSIYPYDNLISYNTKIEWLKKNKNVFYVYADDFGELLAHINLLPITEECYNRLVSGEWTEYDIEADNIYSLSEKNKVRHIYIESFVCINKPILPFFAIMFEKILESLAMPNKNDIQLGAVAGTAEGKLLLRNYGFKKVNIIMDPTDGLFYDFMVSNWQSLKTLIRQDWRHEGKASIAKSRLTKVNR